MASMKKWQDGKLIEVSGFIMDEETGQLRCPTEKCNAFCCRTGSVWPDGPVPCEFLTDNQCAIQKRGGMGAKPFGCVSYPRSQADVDHMNRNAAGEYRCYLSVTEVMDGN